MDTKKIKKLVLKKEIIVELNKETMKCIEGKGEGITLWPTDLCLPTFPPYYSCGEICGVPSSTCPPPMV